MKIYVAHTKDFDYEKDLYARLRTSMLYTEHEFILPHEGESNSLSRETIKTCDLFVAEVSKPSTSLGVEIGWANAFGVPVVAMRMAGTKEPWWTGALCKASFEYTDPKDMLLKLTAAV